MDHFSSLPDGVLCHILSFLTTKEAALTSILAKRWRNLFASVPCLTIADTLFLHHEKGSRVRVDNKQRFMDFVDRVLALQDNSPLKKFSLMCASDVDSDRVDAWISSVLARGVSDLDLKIIIRFDVLDFYPLSPKCFECSTLVTLKIYGGIDITLVAGRIFLTMLKTLVLDWVIVCPNEFKTLLRALPSLEELVTVDVMWKDMEDVVVSSPSVKTLTIKLEECSNTLSIDTPSLLHFEYSGYVAPDYPLVTMGNVVDAQINFYLSEVDIEPLGEPDNDEDALHYSNVWKLFHGIRHVPHLSLLPNTLEGLSMCSELMPVFNNLKSLTIRSDEDRGWQAMPSLLRNCPHLETLVIKRLVHHVTDKCGDVCCCISREDKGLSLKLCPVKVMKIHGFQGTMEEMAMIEHFLEYFPSLKEMQVYAEENNNTTQLGGNHEVPKRVLEMFEVYDKFSSCNVKLMVGDILCI